MPGRPSSSRAWSPPSSWSAHSSRCGGSPRTGQSWHWCRAWLRSGRGSRLGIRGRWTEAPLPPIAL